MVMDEVLLGRREALRPAGACELRPAFAVGSLAGVIVIGGHVLDAAADRSREPGPNLRFAREVVWPRCTADRVL